MSRSLTRGGSEGTTTGIDHMKERKKMKYIEKEIL